jgi:predicted helicase
VQTNRDAWVYNYSTRSLSENVKRLIEVYNRQVREWNAKERDAAQLDSFLESDEAIAVA